ncbi:3501_t:CDS:1, partial [Diversispora eburnea]
MSLPIKKIPFPPSINVDKIIQMHLKNGIKNVNETMNAFMIYRNEFNHVHQNFNLSCKNVSKLASKSWKNEPGYVKQHYKQISKEVKKRFKKIVPTPFFISKFGTSNQVGTNDAFLETNLPIDQNLSDTIYSSHQFINTGPTNQISPDIICYNSLLMNTEQTSLGTTCYNSPPSNPQDAIYSSYPGATHSNLLVDQFSQEFTFADPSKMDQISPDINCFNSSFIPFINALGATHVISPPFVDQYSQITFPDPSDMDQIFPGITRHNLPFLNVLDISHVNSPPSNSLNNIYSSQNSLDATNSRPPMVQYPLEITFLDPNMGQIFLGINCYNSQLMNTDQNSPDATYYNSARID